MLKKFKFILDKSDKSLIEKRQETIIAVNIIYIVYEI